MICSYCRVIEIGLEATVTCLNGHFLCRQCAVNGMSNCMLCEAPMFVMNENGWMSLQSAELQNWTPEMIREWSRQTELGDDEATPRPDDCDLSVDGDEKSLNLLFAKGNNFDAQTPPASEEIDVQEMKWIQPLSWKNSHSEAEESCSKSTTKFIPPRFIKLGCIEGNGQSEVAKKDTRQQLVEKTIEEIRKKVMEEIYKPFKDDPRSRVTPEAHTYAKEFSTIGVSTESAPRLIPEEPISSCSTSENTEEEIKMEQFPRDFLLLQAETKIVPPPQLSEILMKKNGNSSVNMKLQQIVGTFVEEKPPAEADDHHFYKLLREKFARMPPSKLAEIISSLHTMGDKEMLPEIPESCASCVQEDTATNQPSMSNSRRAYYDPPLDGVTATPQFQIIGFKDHKASRELQQTEIIDAATLNIPRSPVICPISSCQRAFFVSDLTRHVDSDHTKVLKERMLPQQCKNFYLDPKLIQFGVSRCQALLTVQDKIKNLGNERFKNLIPIMVMTTRVSLLELCSNKYKPESEEVKRCGQHFIMIWLTGITPPQLPIFFSLTVWARSGKTPVCHVVHSGRLYSVRNPQNSEAVRKSGQMLLLSEKQVELLTNNGRHMLELQITVH